MNAQLLVDSKCTLAEGIQWRQDQQRLWWTDIHGCALWSCDQDGGHVERQDVPERLGSFAFDRDGHLLCAFQSGLFKWDLGRDRLERLTDFEPMHPTSRMNDGRCDRQGRFVAGGIDENRLQQTSSVMRYANGQTQDLLTGIGCANSICFSPDGAWMYFADTPTGQIRRYAYGDGAPLGTPEVFFEGPSVAGFPDGSVVDAGGALWNARFNGSIVQQILPDGAKGKQIHVDAPQVTCACFGGGNLDKLFITTARENMSDADLSEHPLSGGIFIAEPGVVGLPENRFAAAPVFPAMKLLGLAVALLWVGSAAAGPIFSEQASHMGLDHAYTGGWEHFVGGGVAAFDCDGDDLPELYAAGGATPAVLLRNRSGDGRLGFEPDTPSALALTGVTGAYPMDIDSDGRLDLVILRVGPNVLMQGLPECQFQAFDLGFDSNARWTTAFTATWEGDAILPTLVFGNYVDRTNPDGPFEACDQNMLYRPDGDRYAPPAPLAPGFCALSMLISDWGRSGRPDLRISNDRHYYVRNGAEQLWRLGDTPSLYTPTDGWQHTSIWGMGIASRDITGDGLPEVFLTSMGDQKLQHLAAGPDRPTYADVPFETGITAHRPYTGGDGRPSTGWHAAFGDVDNDGLDDIFITKGNVEAMPGSAMQDPNNLLMQRRDGTFVEAGARAGIASVARSRGGALMDLDLDGRLDLVVMNRNTALEIYHNQTDTPGNWVLIKPQQPTPNINAVGAWIEVQVADRIYAREITIGGGHASGQMGFQHFGLGQAQDAKIRVIWPDGITTDWQQISVNDRYRLRRGSNGLIVEPLGARNR